MFVYCDHPMKYIKLLLRGQNNDIPLQVAKWSKHPSRESYFAFFALKTFLKYLSYVLDFKVSPCSDCGYSFFWLISQRLNFMCRRFGTLCSIFIGGVRMLLLFLVSVGETGVRTRGW